MQVVHCCANSRRFDSCRNLLAKVLQCGVCRIGFFVAVFDALVNISCLGIRSEIPYILNVAGRPTVVEYIMLQVSKEVEDVLEKIFEKSSANGDNIITILQSIQQELGYVSEEAVQWFAKRTGIPAAKYYGVATFYSQFHLNPRGENIITVCSGTVCHVKGAQRIIGKLREELKLKGDDQTTRDMKFTLENVNCVGACSIAPVVLVNDKVFGKQSPDSMVRNLKPYKE